MTTLISFLGKGVGSGYRDTTYQFADGDLYEATKYIGVALAHKIKPQKVILLGTAGSMWDVFLENASEGKEEHWLNISDAVKNQNVTRQQLEPFTEYLQQLLGCDVDCILIPFAKNTDEQIQILSTLADILPEKETIILDVTHGFRHLPMLALVAARFLKTVKQIKVEQIYYGALEMTENGQTPVLNLDSLLTMLDWVDALTTFDKDGDYGSFTELLTKEGLEENKAQLLKQAAFFERTSNSSQARDKLNTLFKSIENFESPIFNLFKLQLIKRLTWFKRTTRGLREQQLAKEYLNRKDYVRAIIYAMEGLISHKVGEKKPGTEQNDYEIREKVKKELAEDSDSFKRLRDLRNAIAHGSRNNKDVSNTTGSEEQLDKSLRERFNHLLD